MVRELPYLYMYRAAVGSAFFLFSGDHALDAVNVEELALAKPAFRFLHAGVSGARRRSIWVGAQRGGDAKARGRDGSGWHAEHDVHLQVVQMQIDWLAGWLADADAGTGTVID